MRRYNIARYAGGVFILFIVWTDTRICGFHVHNIRNAIDRVGSNQVGRLWNQRQRGPPMDEYWEANEDYFREDYPPRVPRDRVLERNTAPMAPREFQYWQDGPYQQGDGSDLSLRETDTEDEYDDEYANDSGGNFWSNPQARTDFAVPAKQETRPAFREQRRRSPRSKVRTSIRDTSTDTAPRPLVELYNRIFWFGLDEDLFVNNADYRADRTRFGGTTGKFNGLQLLEQARNSGRQQSNRPSEEDYIDYDEDEEYLLDEDSFEPSYNDPRQRDQRPRRRRQRNLSSESEYDADNGDTNYDRRQSFLSRPSNREPTNWIDAEVSSWFTDEDQEQGGRRKRTRDSGEPGWSPMIAMERFVGINRNKLKQQAMEYDRQMGLDSRSNRRRNKNTMEEEEEEDEVSLTNEGVVEGEFVIQNEEVYTEGAMPRADHEARQTTPGRQQDEPLPDPLPNMDTEQSRRRVSARSLLSREKRMRAIEAVPPPGIKAWGPWGPVDDMDARTKAYYDAVEDIRRAKSTLEERKRQARECKETVCVLNVDVQLERKRVSQCRGMEREIRLQTVRETELDVAEAARKLRYAEMLVKDAEDELAEVEMRHWAVLSLFEASEEVGAVENRRIKDETGQMDEY